jgi:hypothetical protein
MMALSDRSEEQAAAVEEPINWTAPSPISAWEVVAAA